MAENLLYYGDNLDILRLYVQDESVEFVYLDSPFNSDQHCNMLFLEQNGSRASRGMDCPPPRQANVTFRRTPGAKKPSNSVMQNHLFPG